jgi:hypothetical protein
VTLLRISRLAVGGSPLLTGIESSISIIGEGSSHIQPVEFSHERVGLGNIAVIDGGERLDPSLVEHP